MKRKDNRTLQERAEDLEKVYTFSIVVTAKKYYGTVDNLKKIYNKIVSGNVTSQEQVSFCNNFGHSRDEYRKILGKLNGKFVSISDVKPYFSKWFHYQRHFNKNYKSGKTYSVHGYWYIDFDVLERWWDYEDVVVAKSDFYSERQHKLIDTLILKSKTAKKAKKHVEHMNEPNGQMPTIEDDVEPAIEPIKPIADLKYVEPVVEKTVVEDKYDFAKLRELKIAEYKQKQAMSNLAAKENLTDDEIEELLSGIDI